MNPNNRSSSEVYEYLKKSGCCDACCLRFFNGRCDDYLCVEKSLKSRGINLEEKIDHEAKRLKANPCIACLGLLENNFLDDVLKDLLNYPEIDTYICETVLTSVSLPISLNLRQLAIWIGLIKTFPGRFSLEEPPDVPLKEVVKLLLNPRVCDGLKKTFEQNQNGLMVNVFLAHDDEAEELKSLEKINPKIMKERLSAPRKFHKEFMTRNAFEKHFNPSKLDHDLFAKHVPVPGDPCLKPIKLHKITVQGPTVFVAGRYRKLSRELSQSPWVIAGKRMMDDSVQEIIMRVVVPHFGVPIEKANFSSSGREDVDVRCLGRGRPFVIELPDSRETTLPLHIGSKMQTEISMSGKVSALHLQMVQRSDLTILKSGEDTKEKTYRALCTLKEPATVDVLTKLNISEPFTIEQTTPLRVLHRRPLRVRERTISSVKGYVNEGNHCQIILDITTQAGTYVKELVHGEFGRTEPSIRSLIGQWIDIIKLDVTDINLDWPEPIDDCD